MCRNTHEYFADPENNLLHGVWETWTSSGIFHVLSWFDSLRGVLTKSFCDWIFLVKIYSGENCDRKEEGCDIVTYSAPGQLLNPNNVIAFPTALLWAIYILVGSMYLVVLSSERESKMTYFLLSSLVTFTLCNQYLVWKISCLIFSHETRLLNYGSNDIFWIFLLMNLLSVKSLHFNITWGFSIFFCFSSWHRPHSFCVSECIWTHWSYRRENCLILNQIVVLYSDNCGFVFCCVLFAGLNNNTVPYICKHLDLLKVFFVCVYLQQLCWK